MLWRNASHVAIQIGPSCLRVAIVAGGRVLRSDAADLPDDLAGGAWEQNLEPLAEPLAEALGRLGRARRRPAIVLHHQDAPAEIVTSDKTAFSQLAEPFMIAHGLDYPTDAAGVRAVGRAGASGRASLVFADAEPRLAKIAAFLERCNCRCIGVVNARALALARASERASVLSREADAPVGVAFLDEFQSGVAIAEGGVLLAAEATAFGWHHLADAMVPENTRPADRPMLRNQFRAHLFECGAPGTASAQADLGDRIGRPARLLAEPVAQRYAELFKNVLGASGEQGPMPVHLDGSGAALAGLGEYLGVPRGCEVEVVPDAVAFDPAEPGGQGSMLAIASRRHRELGLLTASEESKRQVWRARVACFAGASVAAGLCSLYADRLDARALAYAGELHELAPELAKLEHRSTLLDRAAQYTGEINEMRRLLDAQTSTRFSWAGLLEELGGRTPGAVRYTSVRTGETPGEAIAEGVLVHPDRGRLGLAGLVEGFNNGLSPLIASAEIEIDHSADDGIIRFAMRLRKHTLGSLAMAEGDR